MSFPGGRQGMAVLSIAVIVLAFFFFRKKPSTNDNANIETSSKTTETRSEGRETQVLIQGDIANQSAAQIAQVRRTANQRMEMGLQPIPTVNLGNKLKFGVRGKTFPMGCSSGDFDIIKEVTPNFKA